MGAKLTHSFFRLNIPLKSHTHLVGLSGNGCSFPSRLLSSEVPTTQTSVILSAVETSCWWIQSSEWSHVFILNAVCLPQQNTHTALKVIEQKASAKKRVHQTWWSVEESHRAGFHLLWFSPRAGKVTAWGRMRTDAAVVLVTLDVVRQGEWLHHVT